MTQSSQALLVLEDGSRWSARIFGAPVSAVGEVVFNTSQTGYQEILTDPSYRGQLVVLTMPHIGNTGINQDDDESDRIQASALLCRDISSLASSWRATGDLGGWLGDHGVPGLTGLDTRALVLHLREHGTLRGALGSGDAADRDALLARAKASPPMNGRDLATKVSCREPYHWTEDAGWWRPGAANKCPEAPRKYHVVAYDFGVKRSILRQLAARGCSIEVVPATTPARDVLTRRPDGVFLSNGPGDPAAVKVAIQNVRELLGRVPIFGICLGHQILALALGARTYRLKFGHRGGNHPVGEVGSTRIAISAHNHGFAVDRDSLPTTLRITHVSLNDGCCEGLEAPAHRAFSVQYHPESSPGPHDSDHLFDRFVTLMDTPEEAQRAQA